MTDNTDPWPRHDIGWIATQIEKGAASDAIKKIFKSAIREYEQEKEDTKRKAEEKEREFWSNVAEDFARHCAYKAEQEEAYEKEYKRHIQGADIILDERNER